MTQDPMSDLLDRLPSDLGAVARWTTRVFIIGATAISAYVLGTANGLSTAAYRTDDVRVQEVTVGDIRAEGVRAEHQHGTDHIAYEIAMRAAFRELWDSINADRGHSWESNPWVWVVGFERTKAR